MKTIILFIALSLNIFAQSNLIISMSSEPGTASIDTIPSQFTFVDSTDAALSSYNQAYIVVAGCDSARFYTNGTDSLKLGALGTYDVSEIWADVGDSVYMGNIASVTNSTATHKILYSSNGTPLDTFSVTTVAASGSVYETDSLRIVFDDADLTANTPIATWTDQIESFQLINPVDTTNRAIMTTGGLVFGGNDGYYRPISADPFPLITDAISIEVVVRLADTTVNSAQIILGIKCPSEMMLTLSNNYNGDASLKAWGYDYGDASGSSIGVLSIQGGLAHIVATFDGDVTTKIYVNGVEMPILNTTGGSTAGGDGISLGTSYDNATAYLAAGSIIRYAAIYAKVLTAQQVEDNYNSDTIQGKLP